MIKRLIINYYYLFSNFVSSVNCIKHLDNPTSECGNATQSIEHIVTDYPKRKFEGEMNNFFRLTSEAVD